MPLTPTDIQRIAQLAQLRLDEPTSARMLTQINGFFDIVEQMRAVDTTGV
jgi:aspartyl-tRNA(Asn)/glutamyl-tRNA(Gln) amidotransferase subunit C